MTMKKSHSRHQTQWAAQFAVASELCKRNYQVAMTLGNHPAIDLMVISPKGESFHIDVKGAHKPTYWLVKPKEQRNGLFYVLTHVPAGQPNEFFVMTQEQLNNEVQTNWDNWCDKHRHRRSDIMSALIAGDTDWPGISWKVAKNYLDKWDVLPA